MVGKDFNMIKATAEATMVTLSQRFAGILPVTKINTDLIFVPDELALRMRAEKSGRKWEEEDGKKVPSDKYVLEFMNVWIDTIEFSWDRQSTSVAREGMSTRYINRTPGGRDAVEMHKAIPVDLWFTVSCWTKYKERMDAFIQEFMWWQQDNPNIEFFYDEDKKLEFDVVIGIGVEKDDVSVKSMFREGKYWKHTFRFKVETWIIKGFAPKTAKTIYLDIYDVKGEVYAAVPEMLLASATITPDTQLNIAQMVADPLALDDNERALNTWLDLTLGHIVTIVDSTLTLMQANTYDVVIIGQNNRTTNLSALKSTTAAVILLTNNTSFGLGVTPLTLSSNTMDIQNNNHFITREYATGEPVTISTASSPDNRGFTNKGGEEQFLGETILLICDKDKKLADGSIAAERRANFGVWQFDKATTASKNLLQRVFEWVGHLDLDSQEI